MPVVRSTARRHLFALSTLFAASNLGWAAGPVPMKDAAAEPKDATEVEVRYIDESTMKLKLLDDKLELVTKHGVLQVGVADVRKVELATRLPGDVAEKIATAVNKLGDQDFQARERATAALRNYRERAYPMLVKATKDADPEVVKRSEELIRALRDKVPAGQLEPREFDVIHTDDSKYSGKLTATSLRVLTFQFGEQRLKLADVRSFRSASAGSVSEDASAAVPAPATLAAFQNQFGKEVVLNVTGGQGGGVWGTDVYTLDSSVSAAAVHAGAVPMGQTGVVRVRIVQSPQQFAGSFRNGINSAPYGAFAAGAFEFVRR